MSWLSSIVAWFLGTDRLARAGELAAQEAERLWALDIIDPPIGATSAIAKRSLVVINDILDAAGWAWAGPYRGNGSPQWCGLFAAKCWRVAGIDPKWLATFWASTLRMWHWFRYRAWNDKTAGVAGGGRMALVVHRDTKPESMVFADGSQPRRGDIVVVGTGDPAAGHHINVLVGFDAETGTCKTISGNGGGLGPDGRRREGIVKKDYVADANGYRVLWIYRVGLNDLR